MKWYVLPATMTLYNKRTVTVEQAVSTWGKGTILVCEIVGGDKPRKAFLYTSGGFEHNAKLVGSTHEVYHDQTHAYKGEYKVLNVISFDGNSVIANKVNEIGVGMKASLAVFK